MTLQHYSISKIFSVEAKSCHLILSSEQSKRHENHILLLHNRPLQKWSYRIVNKKYRQETYFSFDCVYRMYHNEVNSLKSDSELKSVKYLVN